MELIFLPHGSGFFSTTTLILFQIINYTKLHSKCPTNFDFSNVFIWYNHNKNPNIFYDFFKINDINLLENICLKCFNYEERGNMQFKTYNELNLDLYYKYVNVYFNLSDKVMNIYQNIINKYKLDFDNSCTLFLRGNDKAIECDIPDYEKYIKKGTNLLKLNPELQFIIQSDEKEFIDAMKTYFPNNTIFIDEIRVISKNIGQTVDNHGRTPEINHKYALNFLAIVYIMSKCKYVICNTGNISFWILMYRQHLNNYIQL